MTVKEFERQLLALPPAEKAQIFHTLLVDLTKSTPGIEKTPGVVGGDACIMRTRIPVWALEGYRRLGWTDQQILEIFHPCALKICAMLGPMSLPTKRKSKPL